MKSITTCPNLASSTRGYLAGRRKRKIKMYAHYVNKLFLYPDQPPPSSSPTLAHFIAYVLHRMRLTLSATFAALYLLQRFKTWFIAACGSSGHRLFISAFMIASKAICDDTYSSKSWCIVGQGMFALREINQMERETCSYLKWQLNVEPGALKGPSPYPAHYTLSAPSSGPFAHSKPGTSNIPTTVPSFSPGAPPSPPSSNTLIPPEKSPRRSLADPYPTSADVPQLPTPPTSHSNVPSPVSSVSPVTPPNYEGDGAKIVSSGGSNTMWILGDNVSPPYHCHVHTRKSSSLIPARTKTHASIDTKHTSPKGSSNGHQHAVPVKSDTMYAFVLFFAYPPSSSGSFAHQYCVDVTDPTGASCREPSKWGLTMAPLKHRPKSNEEYKDRQLRHLIFPHQDSGAPHYLPVNLHQIVENAKQIFHPCYFVFPHQDSGVPHYLPVNLHQVIENAKQIFHIDARKPIDPDPVSNAVSLTIHCRVHCHLLPHLENAGPRRPMTRRASTGTYQGPSQSLCRSNQE